ncbi:uncharacterized protein LOC121738013 isoform X2 [Aricia agestis]|uniref:uncharacterized protein LOC121738013 isoform X2 n=1 Tax=Aricia agestis TaxID=91739 RepID=UPI001C2080A2|nr:uncharacterized protein LOC121738013 isoform X2 [Aricia agestis]
MLLYITNLPFDIRLGRIRQLIHDQCRIDDVILDNLVNDNRGKRVTVGLVDQEQASLVMAKLNGYFLDGHKLQVEHVQKKVSPPQPEPMMKTFNQGPQPMLNYNMMLPQPANYNMNTLLNAMPYYMAQQNFGNARQPAPQTIPFPSFNKEVAGNWYAMNYGNQQYGLSTAQSAQNAGIGNPQKRSHDQSSDIPEKRPRCDGQFGSYSVEEIDDRDRSHDRSHTSRDRDRHDRNDSRDRYDNSRDESYTSRGERYTNRDDRHNNDDYNRRDERDRRNDCYDSPDHRNRRDERNNRDRYDYDDRQDSRDDRQNSRDDRRNSRNERYDRGDNRNDNTGRRYDSDAERSTFDNSNQKSSRVVVWDKNPYKLDRRPNVGSNPPKPLIPQADKPGLLNNPQENFNYQQSFNSPHPIFNKLLHLSGNLPQVLNNQQNFPQSSNNPQKNYNNQQNFPQSSNKPQQNFNKQQKSNNAGKKTLTRNEARSMQYKALNEIITDLLGRFKVPQEAYQNIRRLCDHRLKSIMQQHNCTSIGQFFKHYNEAYPYENDQELVEALREFGITDSSQALPRKPGIESARQRQRKAQASASSLPPPLARKGPQTAPQRPRAPQPLAQKGPQTAPPRPRLPQASAPSLPAPRPNIPKISQPAIVPPRVPPLKPVPAAEKLPKYPNANKNVYREIKKQTQLEAKEDFSYQVDKKYIPTLEYEMRKMRELAIKACMDKSNEKIEKIREEIVNYGIDKVMKAIRMHITKRLSNNFVGNVRINFKYKGPKKAELEAFLKDYNVVSLKKSERGKFYVATCNRSDGYDRLLEQGSALVDDIVLTIKPLNILGKPDKKEMLTKFQNNVNNMALKFQSKMEQARGGFTGQVQGQVTQPVKVQMTEQVKAQVTEPVKANVTEPVKEQMNEEVMEVVEDDIEDLDQSQLDDVEIIYKEDEVIEIKDDCDFSEDVIEIDNFNKPEAQTPQSEVESDNNQNSKQESKARNIEKESQKIEISKQELQNFEEAPQSSGQESQNLGQESQNSEPDLQIIEETDLTIINDELKSAIISKIDDEDLEDF